MKDFDFIKTVVYVISVVMIAAGAYSIWKYIRKDRFESPEEIHGDYGRNFIGGWATLVDGICLLAGGIVVLFMFG